MDYFIEELDSDGLFIIEAESAVELQQIYNDFISQNGGADIKIISMNYSTFWHVEKGKPVYSLCIIMK